MQYCVLLQTQLTSHEWVSLGGGGVCCNLGQCKLYNVQLSVTLSHGSRYRCVKYQHQREKTPVDTRAEKCTAAGAAAAACSCQA